MRWPRIIAVVALALGGCAAPDPVARNGGRPDRIVLHYDFSGAWAATAGDACTPRLGLSDGVFVEVAADPSGIPGRFYAERFFMLETGDRAHALVAAMEPDGMLALTIETETVAGGGKIPVTYRLRLEALDADHVRLTGFRAVVRTQSGESSTDLLGNAISRGDIPVLSAAGERGLCLVRL